MMKKLDCLFLTLYRTVKYFLKTGDVKNYVGGCTYVAKEVHDNVSVCISECENCGKLDISWSKSNKLGFQEARESILYNERKCKCDRS